MKLEWCFPFPLYAHLTIWVLIVFLQTLNSDQDIMLSETSDWKVNTLYYTSHLSMATIGRYAMQSSAPPPHPPLKCTRGPHAYSRFLGKGGNFSPFLSGRFSRKKNLTMGFFFKPISVDMVYFSETSRKIQKNGVYDLYICTCVPSLQSPPEKRG